MNPFGASNMSQNRNQNPAGGDDHRPSIGALSTPVTRKSLSKIRFSAAC
jgi:hypothetical protein